MNWPGVVRTAHWSKSLASCEWGEWHGEMTRIKTPSDGWKNVDEEGDGEGECCYPTVQR